MIVRAAIAFVALAVTVIAQGGPVWSALKPTSDPRDKLLENNYSLLLRELKSTKTDALLLYTDYSARASQGMKQFIRNISRLEDEAFGDLRASDPGLFDNAPLRCQDKFRERVRKIRYDAHRAATFNAENHHKFFLGHMIVFQMHLNKSGDYLRRADRVLRDCGVSCETTPKMERYRHQALHEMQRVRDDLRVSRRMYRDILTHAQRRLNKLRRNAAADVAQAIAALRECSWKG